MGKNNQVKRSSYFSLLIPVWVVSLFVVPWFYFLLIKLPVYIPFSSQLFKNFFISQKSSPFMFGYISQHIVRILILIGLYVSALGFGRVVYQFFSAKSEEDIDEDDACKNIFSLGLGFSFIILFTLFVGLLGLLYKTVIILFLLIGLTLGIKYFISSISSFFFLLSSFFTKRVSLLEKVFIIIITATLGYCLIVALAPETFYDSLIAHLGIPLKWVLAHKIYSIPYNCVSDMPSNIHVLYVIGLMLYDGVLGRLIHFSFSIFTIYIIYFFCRRYINRFTGIFAAALYITTPLVAIVMTRTGVEIGIGVFETLSLFAVINWLKDNNKKWLILAGIMTGMAVGSKYISLFSFIAMTTALFSYNIFFKKNKFKENIKEISIFSFFAFIIACPWYLKNFINWGNPFIPFVQGLGVTDTMRFLGTVDPPYIKWTLKKLFLFPWYWTTGTFQQESFPGVVYIFLLPIALLIRKIPRLIKFILIYLIVYFIIELTVGKGYMRYFLPAFPVIAILLSAYIINNESKALNKIVIFLVIPLMIWNLSFILGLSKQNVNPASVVFGTRSKADYLCAARPTAPSPYYKAALWINENTKKDAKVLEIGETRNFYIKRETFNSNISNKTPVVELVKEAKSSDELLKIFQDRGITHVLISIPEARRLYGYNVLYWDDAKFKVFDEFFYKYLKEEFRFVADMELYDGRLLSQNTEYWNNYIRNPLNYVYVYSVSNEPLEKNPRKINLLLDKYLK